MEKHIRELSDFLRYYGATDFEVVGGGKHNKLQFMFRDKPCSYVIGRRSSGDPRTILNIKTQLKRMLGLPITKEKTHRTLEEMMSDLPPAAQQEVVASPTSSTTWTVRIAAYQTANLVKVNKRRVYITFPDSVVRNTFDTATFNVNKLDEEHWKLSTDGDNNYTVWRTDKQGRTMVVFDDDVEAFSATDGEAVEANDEILIYLARSARQPARPLRGKLVPHPDSDTDDGVREAPPAKEPAPPAPAPQPNGDLLRRALIRSSVPAEALKPMTPEERMREIIRQIREIEAASPYRLVHLADGRIVWRAPTIE